MRGLEHLHPEMREKAEQLQALCRENDLPLLITETWRSESEQTILYAKGRTTPGKIVTNCKYPQSPHCWGVAFDFCRNIRGKEYDNADGFFQKVGKLGKSIGLFWGGDFKSFLDLPHFELPSYVVKNSTKTLINQWGTPEKFKASWTAAPMPKVTDVSPSDNNPSGWAQEAWTWAIEKGITDGTNPHGNVTREMMAMMLWKYNSICEEMILRWGK